MVDPVAGRLEQAAERLTVGIGHDLRTRSAPDARARASVQVSNAEPIPRPRHSGWTSASARPPETRGPPDQRSGATTRTRRLPRPGQGTARIGWMHLGHAVVCDLAAAMRAVMAATSDRVAPASQAQNVGKASPRIVGFEPNSARAGALAFRRPAPDNPPQWTS